MEIRPQGAETILIVDDDELVRASAATLIGSLGSGVAKNDICRQIVAMLVEPDAGTRLAQQHRGQRALAHL